jgi:hypothetical protein
MAGGLTRELDGFVMRAETDDDLVARVERQRAARRPRRATGRLTELPRETARVEDADWHSTQPE